MFSISDNIRYTAFDGATYTFNGAGLSLLRNRIQPDDDTTNGTGDDTHMVTDEMATMKQAQDRGARVWSAPWTPPKALKDRDSFAGGHFVGTPTNYHAYANELADYVASMKSNGIDIYAISIQNEPEWDPTAHGQGSYDACLWSGDQIHDFMPYLHDALAAKNVPATRIIIPESANWGDPKGFAKRTLADPATAAMVGIIGNHNYVGDNNNGDQNTPATVDKHGKQLWQTEISTSDPFDRTRDMVKAIYWAKRIHEFLTTPGVEVNAWHYWRLIWWCQCRIDRYQSCSSQAAVCHGQFQPVHPPRLCAVWRDRRHRGSPHQRLSGAGRELCHRCRQPHRFCNQSNFQSAFIHRWKTGPIRPGEIGDVAFYTRLGDALDHVGNQYQCEFACPGNSPVVHRRLVHLFASTHERRDVRGPIGSRPFCFVVV